MNIQQVQSSPALYQSEASTQSGAKQPAPRSAIPQDRVTISAEAKAKASGIGKSQDHDSKYWMKIDHEAVALQCLVPRCGANLFLSNQMHGLNGLMRALTWMGSNSKMAGP